MPPFCRVSERQVKDTFDGYSQTEYEEYQNRKHPLPTAFEELLHHDVVQAVASDLGFGYNRFSGCCGVLSEGTNGTQKGNRRDQKKFFHSCVG